MMRRMSDRIVPALLGRVARSPHKATEAVMPQALSQKARITFGTHRRGLQIALIAAGVGLSACAMLNKKEQGAIVGAGVGGAVGAVVGNQVGSTAKGAIVGAVVGGVAGTIIGHQMDQQAKELKQNIAGATVERVGEGIQVTFASGLLYDIDSDHIRFESADNLRTLAASLGKYPNTDLLIVGHTDSTGTSAYNQGL